ALAGVGLSALQIAGGVGAIASHFSSRRKTEYPGEKRQTRILDAVFRNALWRLKKKPECAKYIQGNSMEDPAAALEKMYGGGLNKNRVLYGGRGPTLPGGTVDPGVIADVPLDDALKTRGSSGTIFLNDEFFNKSGNVGGWTRRSTMNTINARTMILLHELRHLNGVVHSGLPNDPNSNLIFNQQIAKHCFGVKFD
ncbi:MAG: hypothetical protein C4308_15205, partial [Chitinophagaceae bacterium]